MGEPGPINLRATYRIQLHRGFTFRDATAIVDYLARLGISHLYCSPIMKARPGSSHGYDIVDHNCLNPEIGTEAEFDALVERLHFHGMGLILDIVPNHMGVGADNRWWLDVLEWGTLSPYARYFDIDWASSRPNLEGKVLLPVLGDQFGAVLERGEIELRFDPAAGSFAAWYHEHCFPIAPFDYPGLLADIDDERVVQIREGFAELGSLRGDVPVLRERAAELKAALATAGVGGRIAEALKNFTNVKLGQLIDRQSYRPAYWRVAADEINYRRFFNINDLGGLRVELPALFEETHRTIFRLVDAGKVDGLRVDHIDGLFDPAGYLNRLQARAGRRLPVVVEKILASYEDLPETWPVDGTTGYDNLNLLGGLSIDPAGERPLTVFYRRFTGRRQSFDEILYESKKRILEDELTSELGVLANEMHRLSSSHWRSRDFTRNGLRTALGEVTARFPVYRTYVDRHGAAPGDRRYIDWAIGIARKRAVQTDLSVYDFIAGILTGDLAEGGEYPRDDVLFLAMRFQQLSGPVMAKGLEDTSFYRYFRLIALNEVGGDPRRFGTSVAAFHHMNEQRLKHRAHDMLASSTHDTKRGEDARARIACLSGMAAEWGRRITGWARMNRRFKTEIDGAMAPDRNDELYFYQSLVGVWPNDPAEADMASLLERIEAALIKAVREGKEKSSWANPVEAYEQAVAGFAHRALNAASFLADFRAFMERAAFLGALTSVAETVLRYTMPGVPDLYRGAEQWDLSLVDPDNRRPVDYAAIQSDLDRLDGGAIEDIVSSWADGRLKLWVIHRCLKVRQAMPRLFAVGAYVPVTAIGDRADLVVAFARSLDGAEIVAIVPRLLPSLYWGGVASWGDTALELAPGAYRDEFTGRMLVVEAGPIPMRELLGGFPVALLVRQASVE